jgi:hypothetical protein
MQRIKVFSAIVDVTKEVVQDGLLFKMVVLHVIATDGKGLQSEIRNIIFRCTKVKCHQEYIS